MGTLVSIEADAPEELVDDAFGWFFEVEERCSRFLPSSELRQLTTEPKAVSPILFQAVRFALLVAEESGGAFDPTLGNRMAARGFNREHRSGTTISSEPVSDVSYRDIEINEEQQTIRLKRPLILDLGAVAKGLAVDAAARELQEARNFAIDAGGDLYLAGHNPQGQPWITGIRHPRHEGEMIARLKLTDQAICTSGDYERGEHILDPRTGDPANTLASATVIAPLAMLADALATAAYVMGPDEGLAFLQRMGVEGLLVTKDLRCYETPRLPHA